MWWIGVTDAWTQIAFFLPLFGHGSNSLYSTNCVHWQLQMTDKPILLFIPCACMWDNEVLKGDEGTKHFAEKQFCSWKNEMLSSTIIMLHRVNNDVVAAQYRALFVKFKMMCRYILCTGYCYWSWSSPRGHMPFVPNWSGAPEPMPPPWLSSLFLCGIKSLSALEMEKCVCRILFYVYTLINTKKLTS